MFGVEQRPQGAVEDLPRSLAGIKAVLLHDWITGFRGGERALEALCEIFPTAPLYSLIYKRGSASKLIEDRKIHASPLNHLPGIESHYRKLLPLFPSIVDRMQIEEDAEIVLSTSHCVIKGVRKPKGSVHVCYVHSPMRYMYDQYDHYFGPQVSLPIRLGGKLFRDYLVRWDRASNENVDVMIANSSFVRERIRKYYDRDALVVHPFVDLEDFKAVQTKPPSKTDEYVMVTAFAPNKRVDLAIEAFNRLGKPLTIIGSGQLDRELRSMAGPTVKFLGNVSREAVIEALARSRALVFPGVEDFGITPLEALAAGTPVIALRAGGVLETLTDEDTVFFDESTPESLMGAVERFEREGRRTSFARLNGFSRERFVREMADIVANAQPRGR